MSGDMNHGMVASMNTGRTRKAAEAAASGECVLGVEFGSTRIKAVLIDRANKPVASGSYEWENRLENGVWTYRLEDACLGLQESYRDMCRDLYARCGTELQAVSAIGFSGMMHGYLALNRRGEALAPFRTWRNSTAGRAAGLLTNLFNFNIPQRWSVAHLYQAILDGEAHVPDVAHITTLAGYVHWKLTGRRVLGVGEASGVFPVDSAANSYHERMLALFNELPEVKEMTWHIRDILPEVLVAGDSGGVLTPEGALLIDPAGKLRPGAPLCPPEGDAGTGMVATNSVAPRTGNVSAGTSVFAMIVLEKPTASVHPEIDMVTTPTGKPVAMVHSNNCTSDLNAWIGLFREFAGALGAKVSQQALFEMMYNMALSEDADPDGGGLMAYNYLSGEHITHMDEGRPLFVRTPESRFTLPNFMRTHLFASLGALKIGLDILFKQESVQLDRLLAHGGFFKTAAVGQRIMAAATGVPVSVMHTASEGGAWGIALLAAYMVGREAGESLEAFLADKVFAGEDGVTIAPDGRDVEGFARFMQRYTMGLDVERAAIASVK